MSVVLLLISVGLIVYFFKDQLLLFYYGMKLPGPFVGDFDLLKRIRPENVFQIVTEARYIYKQSFRLWLGPNLWVFLHTPDEARQLLNDFQLTRPSNFNFLDILLGEGLLISQGEKWKAHRRALTPAFHQSVLESFAETICFHANRFVEKLVPNKEVEITNRLFLGVLDIICETSMGAEINSQMDAENSYAQAFHKASHLLFRRMVNPLYTWDFIYHRTKQYEELKSAVAKIHNLTGKLVLERSKFHNDEKGYSVDEFGCKRKRALLDILLNTKINDKVLGNNEIMDEVNTFLFAGVDTTTASMCFVLWCLGKHSHLQKKLYSEITSVIGDSEEIITISHLNSMQYLDIFLKECQRLYTTVPLTGRTAPKNTKIGDFILPKGGTAWVNFYAMAHDSKYFKNPYDFVPERFLESSDESKYAFLPFGGGLHECIGKRFAVQIMKTLIIKTLLQFEINLKNPKEELELISEMSLKSKHGINLIFKRRC